MRGICHRCQAALNWMLSSPQPTDPILPLLAALESGCQLLRWLRWGLVSAPHRTAPHRGDTGYSAEKAAALPPAQLSNCHQQWPPRLAFSIYFPESQLPSSPSTMDLSSQDLLSPAFAPSRLPVRRLPFPSRHFHPGPSDPQGPGPRGYIPLPLSLATADTLDLAHRIILDLSPAFFPATFLPLPPHQKQLKHPSQQRHILANAPLLPISLSLPLDSILYPFSFSQSRNWKENGSRLQSLGNRPCL